MATFGSGAGTPITTVPPAGVGGGGTGTAVIGCATTTTNSAADSCLCQHCQPSTAYTSLEAWRQSMYCVEPWQFWGWDHADLRKARTSVCQDIMLERASRKMVGRQDIRQALLRAESEFLANLKFPPVPMWFSEQLPKNQMLQTRYKYVTKVGAQARTVLGTAQREAQAVSFTTYAANDNSADAIQFSARQANAKWPDTFAISLARPAGLTDASQIALYIHTGDRYDRTADHARWRIEPVGVTLTNAAIIITGRAWLLAKPELYDVYTPHTTPVAAFANEFGLDPSYMPNYVERLEVARLTVNQCDAGLIRTPALCECGGCTCAFDDSGAPTHCHSCTKVDLCIENAKYGHIRPLYPRPDLWNLREIPCFDGDPVSVCIHYQAGDCQRNWTNDIAILATTYLANICECTFPCITKWWEDKAQGENKQNTFEALNNPFGTLAGQVETWKTIERHKWHSVSSW